MRLCRQLFPTAHISYLTGHRCAPVLGMMPALDEIIALDRVALRDGNKLSSIRKILHFAQEMRRRRFDLVIDLIGFRESELLTFWTDARWRIGLKRYRKPYWDFCFNLPPVSEDKSLLVAEMFRKVVHTLASEGSPPSDRAAPSPPVGPPDERASTVDETIIPRLQLTPDAESSARTFWMSHRLDERDIVFGFQMSASGETRTWPTDRFIELVSRLATHARERGHRVGFVNFAAPGEAALCEQVTRAMQEGGNAAVAAIGSPNRSDAIPQLAGLMKCCTAVVSNDTGPMHLSAAVGTPTLGLFSIGVTEHYRPLGAHCSFLKKNPLSLLTVEEVLQEMIRMMEERLRA